MNVASGRPSPALAYLLLAALSLQLLLSIVAPGLAAWSPNHAHASLTGRVHAHAHAWDRGLPAPEASDQPQTQSAPSDEASATALALPVGVLLLALVGAFFVAREVSRGLLRSTLLGPSTPPPQG